MLEVPYQAEGSSTSSTENHDIRLPNGQALHVNIHSTNDGAHYIRVTMPPQVSFNPQNLPLYSPTLMSPHSLSFGSTLPERGRELLVQLMMNSFTMSSNLLLDAYDETNANCGTSTEIISSLQRVAIDASTDVDNIGKIRNHFYIAI